MKHTLTSFEGASASEDGRQITLHGASAPGDVSLTFPVSDIPQLLLSIGMAARDAAENSCQPQSRKLALPVHELEFAASKSYPDSIVLNVVLEPGGPFVPFMLPKATFIRFCEGVLSRLAPQKLVSPLQIPEERRH